MNVLCGLSLLISVSAFTPVKDDTVSTKAKSAFEKTFASSSDVVWKKLGGFYMVNFKIDNQDCSAAYNEQGEFMSASRNITLSQLPLSINLALQSKYAEYSINKLAMEVTLNGESNYYIQAENAKHTLTIKANSLGTLSIENKEKKK